MPMEIFRRIYDDCKPQNRYKLGISLLDSPVDVYREVVVPSNIRLPHLAELLIRTVGWTGYHLYEFQKDDDLYTDKASIKEYKSWPEPEFGPAPVTRYHDYTCYTLGQVLRKEGDSIEFRYDFGDDWKHDVVLLARGKYTDSQDPDFYVIGGEGACPPEDVGGVGGYDYMLRLFKNPKENTEELQNYRQWLPEGFDPHHFDLHATQLRIVDYLRVVRTFTERY